MKKIFPCILVCAAALMANGCARTPPAPPEAFGRDVHLIRVPGASKKNISETVKNATEQCGKESKQYLFVKNLFQRSRTLGVDSISYNLYFSCVDAGDPRLKQQQKFRPRFPTEKADEAQPEEKVTPRVDRRKVEPEPPPAKEPAEEKNAVRPGKEAAPAQEKLPPQEKEVPQKAAEEQPRKKNPGQAEPEGLRNGDSTPDTEPEESTIVEEVIDGEAMDVKNYLKKRTRKKKKPD